MTTRFIRNSRGQVTIFVALMFQVLFLFFAMIVNVGLLVHHKINLQNSVDLAAYYGGMKQAEVLNAIAHVNYQIRQSWKLLVWRQRVLGSAGAASSPEQESKLPLEKIVKGMPVEETLAGLGGSRSYEALYQRPRFCIAYSPHEVAGGEANSAENTCKQAWSPHETVTLPSTSVLRIPGFFGFGQVVANAITQAINQATNRCAAVGALNYVTGARFIIAHNIDSQERAFLINFLATGLSRDEDNFYEISGDQVREGLEKTLRNNLTEANRESLEFSLINGLAQGECRAVGAKISSDPSNKDANVPPWLIPIEVYPVWRYSDCHRTGSNDSAGIESIGRQLDGFNLPKMYNANNPEIPLDLRQQLAGINDSGSLMPQPILVGFEKDPWCMAYVGVKAKSKPKIPFMPLSEIEITAEAYSKPFGGRIGPWYFKNWDRAQQGQSRIDTTADFYNPELMLEKNGPVRVRNLAGITGIDLPQYAPNISRFPGDRHPIHGDYPSGGYAIERVLAYFHRALRPNYPGNTNLYAQLGQGASYPFQMASGDLSVSLRYYEPIASAYNTDAGKGLDQLSWDMNQNKAPRIRLLEIAGLAPNLFDLSYYSIEPDFYNNYWIKIQENKQKRPGWDTSRKVLGDFGARFGGTDSETKFNIFDQIRIQRDVLKTLGAEEALPYAVRDPQHLLNSWAVDNLLDYSQNTRLGKCLSPNQAGFENLLSPPTPGNCVLGGRVGFSVKLVAKDYLKSGDLQLGGQGVPPGAIRNPPPEAE